MNLLTSTLEERNLAGVINMKKLLLVIITLCWTALSSAHSGRTDSDGGHNKTSDGTYHFHNSGNNSSGLGDWTGTDSIGAWLGVLLILYFIYWFGREYFKEKDKEEKKQQRSTKVDSTYFKKDIDAKSETKSKDKPNPFEGSKTSDNLTLYLSDGDYYITGVENGKSVEYYEDGSKLYEGNWINGKQDGVSFAYHSDGSIWLKMCHNDGVRNGPWDSWHPNRKHSRKLYYINGKLERTCYAWYEDGSMKHTEYYVSGILQKGSLYFDINGKPTTKDQQFYDDCSNDEFAIQTEDDGLKELQEVFNSQVAIKSIKSIKESDNY